MCCEVWGIIDNHWHDITLLTAGSYSDYPSYADLTLLDANENSFGPSIPMIEETTLSFHHDATSVQSALDFKQLQLHRYPDA